MNEETNQKNCVLHPERKAVADPQGLLTCAECWDGYREERGLNLQFADRPVVRKLIAARHDLEKVDLGRR